MKKTIVGLYNNRSLANLAFLNLRKVGFGRENIALIFPEARTQTAGEAPVVAPDRMTAAEGACLGALALGLAGFMIDTIMRLIPGAIAALGGQPIGVFLDGAAAVTIGVACGAVVGALIVTLLQPTTSEDEIETLIGPMRARRALVAVSADEKLVSRVVSVLNGFSPLRIEYRNGDWRSTDDPGLRGWPLVVANKTNEDFADTKPLRMSV